MELGTKEIMEIIPHRQPFLLIDTVQEALAQLGAVAILSKPEFKGKTAFFASIKSAKFKEKVLPGDVLTLEIEIIKQKGPIGVGAAKATNQKGKITAVAELTFAIS